MLLAFFNQFSVGELHYYSPRRPLSRSQQRLLDHAGYDFAPIAIDSAALSYQLSDLKIFSRLTVLRLATLFFLD
jgi:hypothetical protein